MRTTSRRFASQFNRRRGRRGAQFEARAGIVVFDSQFEAVQIGDGLGDAKAEPVSRRLAAPLAAKETVKYLCALLRGDADARVAHKRKRAPFHHPGLDPDRAAGGRELYRVVDQVRKGFAHEVPVATNRDRRCGVYDHRHALRFGERLIEIEELGGNRGEIEVLELLLARPLFYGRYS